MGVSSIPVDLFNPGQVFACLGLAEVAQVLVGEARGAFDWSSEGQVSFRLSAGNDDPVLEVLEFLAHAKAVALVPYPAKELPEKWEKALSGVEVSGTSRGASFPIFPPASAATSPLLLSAKGKSLCLSHWGDDRDRTGLDNVKFWAGSGGYPGVKLIQDALALVPERLHEISSDPFNFSAEQSSSCRFDWRRDYIPLDIGFSINAHSKGRFATMGYPLVEVLATIGLSFARPARTDPKNKLEYRYGALGADSPELYPLSLLRASLGAPKDFPFSVRRFLMHLGWPGKEGQARCITTVTEEHD